MPNDPKPQAIDPRWAWQRFRPDARSPWDIKKVGHLFRRATFGATSAELEEALRAGPGRTIDQLLEGKQDRENLLGITSDRVNSISRGNDGNGATAWWVYRMLYA